MSSIFHSHHPFRIFLVSGLITVLSLAFVGWELGPQSFFIAAALILIEVTFSFDNAIINAKVLGTMSRFWQNIFMTIGIFIAVFGMRLVFPIVIVMITAGLTANDVIQLAVNEPLAYSEKLDESHITISSFGGMFLLMLGLHFFFTKRKVLWLEKAERVLQHANNKWGHVIISFLVLLVVSFLPANHEPRDTFVAGLLGIITYMAVHGLAELFSNRQEAKNKGSGKLVLRTGLAGFTSFLYLEVLDASFSFDSVIGAFAITQDVLLIAIGLGIGALWVRSLTLYMVRKEVLHAYRYLEHGAHYTIGVLALFLLSSIYFNVPEVVAGLAGLLIIGLSILSSIMSQKHDTLKKV
jgi:hypothetical protein